MSVSYDLEFYMERRSLDRNVLRLIFSVLKKHNMKFGHFYSESLDFDYLKLDASLSESEMIDAIVKEGSICFSVGDGYGSYGMSVYPDGLPDDIQRSKRLGESSEGEVPFGYINFHWTRSDQEYNQVLFKKTLEITPDFYEALHPIYGQSCEQELMGPDFYNLIPTEKNIFENGPKDIFDINLWSPDIVSKLDLNRLKKETSLLIKEMKDGGLFIHISPEAFMSGDRRELIKAEQILGWYRKDRREIRIF